MKNNGFKNLMKWAKPHLPGLIAVMFLSVLNPLLYSYVPQFIKYIVDVVFESNLTEGRITLPSFLVSYYNTFKDQLTAVVVVGISIVLLQIIRGIFMFLNGYIKGKLSEGIAYDMRVSMFQHIQDLSFTYHNNVDTGDLIQRCTSDNETIKAFERSASATNQYFCFVYIRCDSDGINQCDHYACVFCCGSHFHNRIGHLF